VTVGTYIFCHLFFKKTDKSVIRKDYTAMTKAMLAQRTKDIKAENPGLGVDGDLCHSQMQ